MSATVDEPLGNTDGRWVATNFNSAKNIFHTMRDCSHFPSRAMPIKPHETPDEYRECGFCVDLRLEIIE